MANPFSDIANSIDEAATKHAGKVSSSISLELGTITASGGLQLDSMPRFDIPDYLVADWLQLQDPTFTTTTSGSGVNTPEQLKPLAPGDRVLVAPINGGEQQVVVARVRRRS